MGRAIVAGDRVRGTVAVVSHNCTKIDSRTIAACRDVAELREERAAASEAKDLEVRASALRDQVIALRDRGGAIAPDPVAEFYAWITRGIVSVRDVGFGFPLFFALLIEVVSAFGPLTIAGYAEASRVGARSEPKLAIVGHDRLQPARAGQSKPEDGHVVSWIAERAVPMGGNSAIAIEELHADYTLWCAENELRAGSIALFEEEFDRVRDLPDLAGKIRKFGDRYYGVGLVRRNMRALTARRSESFP